MRMKPIGLLSMLAVLAAGCATDNVFGDPELSGVSNPQQQEEARTVVMPMPSGGSAMSSPNSLWDVNKRSFFRDQRANNVGDILTVMIDIQDQARLRNSTRRSREAQESFEVGSLFGAGQYLDNELPDVFDPSADLGSESDSRGDGEINRNETISLRIAAVVTDRLPNGNFVIAGRQEVRVNSELRELRIAGVIRPEDISASNSIEYFKIAEARIAYGGRGTITRVQKPRYGQRLYEIVVPF